MNNNTIYQTSLDEKRQAVKRLQDIGLDPFPLLPGSKEPKKRDWHKRAAEGYSPEDFAADSNIGVLLGGPQNITDLDCDDLFAVNVAGDLLSNEFEETLTFGRASKPRSHYIFSCDEPITSQTFHDPISNKVLIELRSLSKNGERSMQTVFPSSIHGETGEAIEFDSDSPNTIAKASEKKLNNMVRVIAATALLAKYFPSESRRHDCILAMAGTLARSGVALGNAIQVVSLAYQHSKGFNHDLSKVENDIKGVYRALEASPETHLYGYSTLVDIILPRIVDQALEWLNIPKPPTAKHYPLTDAGNGNRFVDMFRDRIRYCVDTATWFVWNGKQWKADTALRVNELAKTLGNTFRDDLNSLKAPSDPEDKEAAVHYLNRKRELQQWIKHTESVKGLNGVLTFAKSDPRIICQRSDFDRQSHLLNAANGVVDLRSGELLPHNSKLMLSQICPTAYKPSVTHPTWETSLEAFTRHHSDLRPFLRVLMGYMIQANKCEEIIVVFHGPGASGKGTFFHWIMSALGGDYMISMSPDSITKQNRNAAGPSSDLARQEGSRGVIVSEFERHHKLAESLLKSLSGNDYLIARELHQKERPIKPSWVYLFQSNFRLKLDVTDSGNLRRYMEVPFDNELAKDPQLTFDKSLKIRMAEDETFKEAVLAWLVQGAMEWYANRKANPQSGIPIFASVEQATKDLFKSNDFLSEFMSDCVELDQKAVVPVCNLRKVYEYWCTRNAFEPVSGRTFSAMLQERGYKTVQKKIGGLNTRCWQGLRILPPNEDQHQSDTSTEDQLGQALGWVQ